MILKTSHLFRVYIAVSTIQGVLSNAKFVKNGSAMERVRMTTDPIFFGTWSKPITKRFKCITSLR